MHTVFGPWQKLISWLGQGQNAAAIQALAAVATLVFSLAILYLTFRYVRLTGASVALARA
jgi:hypothetical protein